MSIADPGWIVLTGAMAVTYVWRLVGVAVSGRLDPGGELFRWVS